MSGSEQELREALAEIARIAQRALHHLGYDHGAHGGDEQEDRGAAGPDIGCVPKQLPGRLQVKAAQTATRINPANGLNVAAMASLGLSNNGVMDPLRIAVLTAKYWGPRPRQLTVSFMESTAADLRARIVSHLNAWNRSGGISFVETRGIGQVRISRGGGGYWSYFGTDILLIPQNQQTMNLEGFTMSTPEGEYRRVVRHEAGHTLGFPHEHMRKELIARIDREKAYDYFWRTQGWDRAIVDQQVLTPLDDRSIMGTPADQDSIMCHQLPGSITQNGEPIRGGADINATDAAFCGQIYPKAGAAAGASPNGPDDEGATVPAGAASHTGDWDPHDDVEPGENGVTSEAGARVLSGSQQSVSSQSKQDETETTSAVVRAIANLESRIGGLFAQPTLVRFRGQVLVEVTTQNGEPPPRLDEAAGFAGGTAGRLIVQFKPDQLPVEHSPRTTPKPFVIPGDIRIMRGEEKPELVFNVALESDTVVFDPGRSHASCFTRVNLGSEPEIFKFTMPSTGAKHEITVVVSQFNRLIQVVTVPLQTTAIASTADSAALSEETTLEGPEEKVVNTPSM